MLSWFDVQIWADYDDSRDSLIFRCGAEQESRTQSHGTFDPAGLYPPLYTTPFFLPAQTNSITSNTSGNICLHACMLQYDTTVSLYCITDEKV